MADYLCPVKDVMEGKNLLPNEDPKVLPRVY